jgi:antitoxin component YwqK of YwqJK toxin-antitoxin module
MKKLILLAALITSQLRAQTLNDKGFYIDSDGELFNGVVSMVQNNLRSELTVKQGLISGPAVYFNEEGKILETGAFEKGARDGKWMRFNSNGTISAIAFYKLGKKDSTWLVFDDGGNKRFEMNYSNGEKTGTWTSWDENGSIVSVKDHSKVN